MKTSHIRGDPSKMPQNGHFSWILLKKAHFHLFLATLAGHPLYTTFPFLENVMYVYTLESHLQVKGFVRSNTGGILPGEIFQKLKKS